MAALATVAGGAFWLLRCPCGTVTGFVLRGDLHETPVTDWRFANDVPLCQIQIAIGWRPHSVNVNCMATRARKSRTTIRVACASRGSSTPWS
jgi:hypothetical protein